MTLRTEINKTIISKHILIEGGNDTNRFMVVPHNDLTEAIHQLVISMIPEKKEIPEDIGNPKFGWAEELAYNQHYTDTMKALGVEE